MVDHMKLHYGGSTDYIFGTTRTHLRHDSPGTQTQVHIFRFKLKSDHKIDHSNDSLEISRIHAKNLG